MRDTLHEASVEALFAAPSHDARPAEAGFAAAQRAAAALRCRAPTAGTRGRAPYDIVLTHGFVLDGKGLKMSKSKGNVVAPQSVIKDAGADILRLWVAASDYTDDLRIGPEIVKTFAETYRKLRNSLRWMLGSLAHRVQGDDIESEKMPELERLILHRLAELDGEIREAYAAFDTKRVVALLNGFMTGDLSSFYFDVRKDVLYCDPASSPVRRAALQVIDETFRRVTVWLAPVLAFTALPEVRSQLALTWGTETFLTDRVTETAELVKVTDELLLPVEGYNEDDLIVIVAGNVPGVEGSTNFILVHRIGEADH